MTEMLTTSLASAHVVGDELVLCEFIERDPEVISFVDDADDVEEAVHRCLEMGARVLRIAGATLDAQVVEHRFDTMTAELGHAVDAFAQSIDESSEKLLDDETGQLTIALQRWLEEVSTLLGATFDESSKKSAIAKLDTLLEQARTEQVKSMRTLLDPENGESPLASWRSEIVKTVERQGRELQDALNKLREQLALGENTKEILEQTAIKGFTFEKTVLETLTEIVHHLEDVPEHVGDVIGSAGSKVGDLVVTVNPAQTPGRAARYVFEAKDKPMTLKNALAELDKAAANRDADAAVMVFARQDCCPVDEPFQWYDHKALVVLDKKTLDRQPLRLACLWARWVACREEGEGGEGIDIDRVHALIESARLTLKTAATIKGSHTKAQHAIDEAGRQLGGLTGDLAAVLAELEGTIASAE